MLTVLLASAAAAAPHGAAPGVAPDLVPIPAGAFMMGSPETEPDSRVDETPHQVLITQPFLLATTEVTQAQWRAVMGTAPGYFPDCDACPVESVSWVEATEFCNALSRLQGLTPAYEQDDSGIVWRIDADGYRLPTEAEWEFACRAGTVTAYSTGPCLSADAANYNGYHPLSGCAEGMNRGEPIEVARFAPNAWGLYDMHGNINEWCWDRYAEYPVGMGADPRGPATGDTRVFRGGCWANFGPKCRSANRESNDPTGHWDMIGFRVARSPARTEAPE